MNITNDTLPNRPTYSQTQKALSIVENSDYDTDVYIILFRKLDGTLTQRVASRLSYTHANGFCFFSSMESNRGEYRSCKRNRVFSLTKVSKNQIEKLAFADRL